MFAVALKTASECGGIFMSSVVNAGIWSEPLTSGTEIKLSQSETVLFLMSTTACAPVKKSIPSIASNPKFSTAENAHGMVNPAILTSAVISAITGIGDKSAASNLLYVVLGLTVQELANAAKNITVQN
jgi:hypothetical protein